MARKCANIHAMPSSHCAYLQWRAQRAAEEAAKGAEEGPEDVGLLVAIVVATGLQEE